MISKQTNIRKLLVVACAIVIVAVPVTILFWWTDFETRIRPETSALTTIGRISDYVEQNDGKWPTSWSDLELPEREFEPYVHVRFDLNSQDIVDNPDLILTAVSPKTDQFVKLDEEYFASHLIYIRKRIIRHLK